MNNPHWAQCHFVVVDVEGNGQSPQEIIELAIVPISDKQIGSPRSWLIRPQKSVTERATQIHGISDGDLSGSPSHEEVADDIRMELGTSIVVGHNVSIDTQLMRRQLGDWHPTAILDTLKLARYVRPGQGSYSLDALISAYNLKIDPSQRHRASGDAMVTAELFLALAIELDQNSQLDLLALAQIAGSSEDPYIQSQQRSLF
ncbi:3'-5' exonuclease [Pseudomonas sp.]|uniref:3'-5' exonuclease n=1 Tax=Pseudomonas sp. TaxID=306 RepID=UPI000E840A39|nr:3'-5' exonuclease [Pseudomonas sp.]HBP47564.1 DNA polymerase III subunit epsilon [Pseudomonas sp.]